MFHPVKQNSDEPCPCCGKDWMQLRAGKVTGSAIGKVMANYGKSFGEPAKGLAINIATVEMGGEPTSTNFSNEHTERGHEQEPIARAMYEDEHFVDVKDGGFYDNGRTGCSPDGLVGTEGVIEIKSVINSVHYKTVQKNSYDSKYKWQVVFNFRESGMEWIDYISFCQTYIPGQKLFVHRITKDMVNGELKMIELRLRDFFCLVDDIKNKMRRV